MQEVECTFCGNKFQKRQDRIRERNFCSRDCLAKFRSKAYNPEYLAFMDYTKNAETLRRTNPETNKRRMTEAVKEKLRESRLDSGEGKSYRKVRGRHEHRTVAEGILGRPLKKGEVVHHVDGKKRNNLPENLMIFNTQADHVRYHAKQREEVSK